MKKCPFCAEEIQDEAIKCKHCGSILDTKKEIVNRQQIFKFDGATPEFQKKMALTLVLIFAGLGSIALFTSIAMILWSYEQWFAGFISVGLIVVSLVLIFKKLKSLDSK